MKNILLVVSLVVVIGVSCSPGGQTNSTLSTTGNHSNRPPLLPPPLYGDMTSSGGELLTVEKNPWFIGSKPVHYCIIKGEDFSASLNSSKQVIKEAIDDWTRTLSKLNSIPTRFMFPDG